MSDDRCLGYSLCYLFVLSYYFHVLFADLFPPLALSGFQERRVDTFDCFSECELKGRMGTIWPNVKVSSLPPINERGMLRSEKNPCIMKPNQTVSMAKFATCDVKSVIKMICTHCTSLDDP